MGGKKTMTHLLFVGNIPYNAFDDELQDLFSQAGTVKSARIIRDSLSKRSRGFGFVEMSTPQAARSAIPMFHDKLYKGRPLFVRFTRQEEAFANASVYIGSLAYTIVDTDLQSLFSQAGTVISAMVTRDEDSGRSRGFGVVVMASPAEAQAAVAMFHGKNVGGRQLRVTIVTKLYIGNLPYGMTDANLQNWFSQAGTVVTARVIRDQASARPVGFGFVVMASEAEAISAIQVFHGKHSYGRVLEVKKTDYEDAHITTKVYIGNLPPGTGDANLEILFSYAGGVPPARVFTNHSGHSLGFGVVDMLSISGAQYAVSMFDGKDYEGRRLDVHIIEEKAIGPGEKPTKYIQSGETSYVPPQTNKRLLQVFLCYAHSDVNAVQALYQRLKNDRVDIWLDKESLLPGVDWEYEIQKAVRQSDVVVVCLSKNFNQEGFRQKEVRLALETAMRQPEGEIFIIPARLEECDNLASLRKWHWVNLFEPDGYERLMRALRVRAQKVGAVL
jgi:RNA recognition motif-containing protein